MVEEIHHGTLNILQAAVKYQVNRSTVKRWLAKIEDEKQQQITTSPDNPPKTVVEQIANRADKLEGKVKELEKALKEAQMKALYYSTLLKVAEQELGIQIEKSPLPSNPIHPNKLSACAYKIHARIAWFYSTSLLSSSSSSNKRASTRNTNRGYGSWPPKSASKARRQKAVSAI
jgi:transposase